MTVWPEKMITQAEAFAKAANWPVEANHDERGEDLTDIVLVCMKCQQSCGQLRRGITRHNAGTPYNASLDEMLSMVLRHMVMAHDVPLNTRGQAATEVSPGWVYAGSTEPVIIDRQDNGPSDGSTP